MNGEIVEPAPTAKLPGVIFDHEMRWKEHVQHAIKRATTGGELYIPNGPGS